MMGNASKWLLGMEPTTFRKSLGLQNPLPPKKIYDLWVDNHSKADSVPPIEAILDEMWPKWELTAPSQGRSPADWAVGWEQSFNRIETWLNALASESTEGPDAYTIRPENVPVALRDEVNFGTFKKLPPAAVIWVEQRRAQAANVKRLSDLIDTGTIVVVIGAFGGVLFLLAHVVTAGRRVQMGQLRVEDFVFRPLFGALLAVAFLLADIVTHAVLSTGSVLEIRRESMYGLALAAGVFSEVAYRRLGKWLGEQWPSEAERRSTHSRG